MPKIGTAIPTRRYQLGEFTAVGLGDVESKDSEEYRYVMANMASMMAFYSGAFQVQFREVDTYGIRSQFGELNGITLKFVPIRDEGDFKGYPIHQPGFVVPDVHSVIDIVQKSGGRQEGQIIRAGGKIQAATRPDRDASSRETGLATQWPASGPPLAWKATGMRAGFSSLAIVDGRIYTLGDRDGAQYLLAFSAEGGAPLWKTRVGPVWSDEYGGPRGTPTVASGLVFALGTEGDLIAVEAATGKEVWRRSMPSNFGGKVMSMWKWSESPLVDGDRVIVTPGAADAGLVALEKASGKELWRSAIPELGPAGKDGAGYSSVVISNASGVKQYVQLLGRESKQFGFMSTEGEWPAQNAMINTSCKARSTFFWGTINSGRLARLN